MMEATYRAVVTGIGVLSPNGIGKDVFWEALLMGISGIKSVTFIDVSSYPSKIAGEITDFNPLDFLDSKLVKRTSRSVHLGMAAASLALQDAGIQKEELDVKNTEIVIGVGCPLVDSIAESCRAYFEEGPHKIHPYALSASSIHSPAGTICKELGLRSSSITLSTGCTAGLNAIGYAFQIIKTGGAKTIITGGFDAPINEITFAAFCRSRLLTTFNGDPAKASRPFDKMRDGGILSEGAAVIILEELNHALKEKRTIYGEITGFGNTGEFANGPESNGVKPHAGMTLSIQKTLKDANILPEQIDYISAHAPSDPMLDKIETDAIKEIFGAHAYRLPISSIKSTTGNPVAAAAPMQVAAALLALNDQRIPPTTNYEYPDPDCNLDYVPNKMRYNSVSNVLVNSHGIGGNCSAMVVKKYES